MELSGDLISVGHNWTTEVRFEPNSPETADEVLRLSAMHDPPYLFIKHHPNGSHSYDGYLFDLWQVLVREVGVRYRITPLPGGGYGRMNGNGTWTGLVGEIVYGRADLALSWLGMITNRTSVVDFVDVIPVSSFREGFFVRSGPNEVPKVTETISSLLKPLHRDVWLTLFVSMLVISVLLRVSLRLNQGWAESGEMVEGMTWGSCVLNCFRSVTGQGWASTPESLAARTVTLSNWMLGILLTAGYTANLMCHLTVPTAGQPIHNLNEFIKRGDWNIALEPDIGVLNVWKVSQKPHERELFRRVDNRDRYIELYPKRGNRSALNTDKVLMFADIKRLRYALGRESCDLVPLPDVPADPEEGAFIPIAKGRHSLRRKLNRALLAMAETGLLERLRSRWMTKRQSVCDQPVTNYRPLSVANLLAMLLIVPLAVASSVACLMAELLWSRTHTSLRRRLAELGTVLANAPVVEGSPAHEQA